MGKALKVLILLGLSSVSLCASEALTEELLKTKYKDLYEKIKEEGKKEQQLEAQKKELALKAKEEKWWLGTSYLFPRGDELVVHGEGQLGHVAFNGNMNGTSVNGQGFLVARKNQFTAATGGKVSYRHTKDLSGSQTDRDFVTTNTYFQYDIDTLWFTEVGNVWERNSVNYIKDRYIYYGGIGVIVPFGAKYDKFLKIFGAYGTQDERYMSEVSDALGFSKRNMQLAYMNETLYIPLSERVTATQDLKLYYDLGKTDKYEQLVYQTAYIKDGEANRLRYDLTLSLEIALGGKVFLVPTFVYSYDDNPWPGTAKLDKTLITNIKYNF